MSRKIQEYRSDTLTVTYEPVRCIHAAECVRRLPAVFNPELRPWVEMGGAAETEIIEVVERCPTGALRYTSERSEQQEQPAPNNIVEVRPRGPLYVRGDLRMTDADGQMQAERRAALCRCGASANKPFCDNSHRDSGFDDPGELGKSRLADADTKPGELVVATAPNGPLLLAGPVEVRSKTGTVQRGTKTALCRCGASANKPYCDGAHVEVGFSAD